MYISSVGWLKSIIKINLPYIIAYLTLISVICIIISLLYLKKMIREPIKNKKNTVIEKYAFFIGLVSTTSYFLISKQAREQIVPIISALACLVLAVFFQYVAILFIFKYRLVRLYRNKY